jgi:hypothetical protein
MKPPPTDPEFARFTKAMQTIMGVSKTDIQKRIAEEKEMRKRAKRPASPDSASSSNPAR